MPGLIEILAIIVFIVGYFLIATEHTFKSFKTHKSAIAIGTGGVLWLLVAFSDIGRDHLKHLLHETSGEIFGIIVFLLSAMTLVEILIHYRFFDLLGAKLLSLGLKDRSQFIVMGIITFFLSAVIDGTTLTIVMTQIARKFFKGTNLLIVVTYIVVLSNVGGSWSPTGDINTLMIWLAGKVNTLDLISHGFFPAATYALVMGGLLLRNITTTTRDEWTEKKITLSKSEITIIVLSMISFMSPLFVSSIGLEPFMGRLLGLGVVWSAIEIARLKSKQPSHVEANVEKFLQKTDISSLNFLIGILLSVSALANLGILEQMAQIIFGIEQEFVRLVSGIVILSIGGAVIDNVPLTAIALNMINSEEFMIWILLSFCVTAGGSLLIVGSIPGVVAMGMLKEMTFGKYIRIAFVPGFIALISGVAVWLLQYQFLYAR